MMTRYFNVAGPCNEAQHYMIEASSRLTGLKTLIDRGQYFVIHAPRQSGKTTFLMDLVNRINREGKYYALQFGRWKFGKCNLGRSMPLPAR